MNVLFELETDGDEFIWIHELKLSDETWNDPEQEVLVELVVTVELSIASEKVTEMLSLTETEVSLSEGDVEETVGDAVSAVCRYPSELYLTRKMSCSPEFEFPSNAP